MQSHRELKSARLTLNKSPQFYKKETTTRNVNRTINKSGSGFLPGYKSTLNKEVTSATLKKDGHSPKKTMDISPIKTFNNKRMEDNKKKLSTRYQVSTS
jgi:hypothetical protein